MAENKTRENDKSVQVFLEGVGNDRKREDSFALVKLMQEVTGEEPRMWGDSIVGFGRYHYKYASGREGDSLLAGFSPRKDNFAVYIMSGFEGREDLLSQLGKHKTGKACLYIKTLQDVDEATLRELVRRSYEHMRDTNPS